MGGNITSLTDAGGNVVARYLYDPFGGLLGKWGALADANRYRFSSKELHPASGMYYYGYRFFDPNLQRWINRDPIREAGGMNLYVLVGNKPLTEIDDFGLLDDFGPPTTKEQLEFIDQANQALFEDFSRLSAGFGGLFSRSSRTFAGGTDLHLSWVNPFTSRGGGVLGHNKMTFFGRDNKTKCYVYNGSGVGFDLGIAAQSVWAWGSGDWTGTFDSVTVNAGPLTGSMFWSPGESGWTGFTFGVSLGPPAGAAYEQTEYYKLDQQ